MQVLVQAKNIPITPTIEAAVQRQAQKLARLSSKILRVMAFLEVVEKKKNEKAAACVMFKIVWPGRDLVIEERAANLYDAMVDAADSAVRVLRKEKERRRTRRQTIRRMATA